MISYSTLRVHWERRVTDGRTKGVTLSLLELLIAAKNKFMPFVSSVGILKTYLSFQGHDRSFKCIGNGGFFQDLRKHEIDEMIANVDKNGDGKISYSEFRVMMGAVPLLLPK